MRTLLSVHLGIHVQKVMEIQGIESLGKLKRNSHMSDKLIYEKYLHQEPFAWNVHSFCVFYHWVGESWN